MAVEHSFIKNQYEDKLEIENNTEREMPYYVLEGIAKTVYGQRYGSFPDETFLEGCHRVSSCVALAEEGENIKKYSKAYFQELATNRLMAGGRIWHGAGKPRGNLINCFVIPTGDSREAWGKATSETIVVSGVGGGVGINCSSIRPRGSIIQGTGGQATGSVSFMELINSVGEVIKAGGGRRVALMLCLNIDHPDIMEFLDKKLDLKLLNNANISVWFNENPEIFFEKVRNDADHELKFNGKTIAKVKAREIWKRIISNALKTGEPGILNGYLCNKMSNIAYHSEIISTNPCGEIPMQPYSCCDLGAIVLPRFVDDSGNFNWKLLQNTVEIGVRFLDDVLTVNNYPITEIAEECRNTRRLGLGVLGLADMLILKGYKYNSDEGLEFVNKVMKFIKETAYNASCDLAREKGPFLKFDAEQVLKSNFVKTLKPSLRSKIKEYGLRNCALLTIAPTGTTSIISGFSSGIEAIFSCAYERRWWVGDKREMEVVVHPLFKKFAEEGRDLSAFQSAYELSLRDHFEMQRVCQQHIDNATSKTINVPPGTSEQELSDLYMEYFPELKGVTVYPEGSRENQPLTPLSVEQALEYVKKGAIIGSSGMDSCKNGKCDI